MRYAHWWSFPSFFFLVHTSINRKNIRFISTKFFNTRRLSKAKSTVTSSQNCHSFQCIMNDERQGKSDFLRFNGSKNSFPNHYFHNHQSSQNSSDFLEFLAHLSWKLKWDFLITFCPSSVRPSVCLSVNFSHFHLLLQNQWANFNQTWHKAFISGGNSSLCKWRATSFSKGR